MDGKLLSFPVMKFLCEVVAYSEEFSRENICMHKRKHSIDAGKEGSRAEGRGWGKVFSNPLQSNASKFLLSSGITWDNLLSMLNFTALKATVSQSLKLIGSGLRLQKSKIQMNEIELEPHLLSCFPTDVILHNSVKVE